jgi:hypothetical protein
MAELTNHQTPKQAAGKLLDWLTAFFPTAIPASAEAAILDDSGDINALLWHRSELEGVLQKTPSALTGGQKQRLANLDTQIRRSALLIVGAEKGELRRFREGRYDRSHWWWYLDDMLNEANLVCNHPKAPVQYAMAADKRTLSKVADARAEYKTKPRSARK